MANTLQLVNQFAQGYDSYIKNCQWYGPDMLFGMMYEYLTPSEQILDLGTGTGLCASLFHKAGLKVFGVDGSEEMLKICKSKNITVELKLADLTKSEIPFDIVFHHTASFALFHFLPNLEELFLNIASKTLAGGTFGFSVDVYDSSKDHDLFLPFNEGIYRNINSESGLITYKYSFAYILDILKQSNFTLVKNTQILAFKDSVNNRTVWFNLIVAKLEKKPEQVLG